VADATPSVGRFAPSPTGPLHFGSLVAAVGSYLHAKSANGKWHLRIEDLDPPREAPGAVASILTTLERFGFRWDGAVEYQSQHGDRYLAALDQLIDGGHAYPCACTRKEIADSAITGIEGPVYPGTCRDGVPDGKQGRAWRVRTDGALEKEIGDFIVRRADGYWAYQLAVVVDDAALGVTQVVRGADLIGSTSRQVHLQRLLGFPMPTYLHLPVVLAEDGRKLSKSLASVPLGAGHEAAALVAALRFLGQQPPESLAKSAPDDVWAWALEHWDVGLVDGL
jgi:glutamyl-Q tRNA(Asp) synthetase